MINFLKKMDHLTFGELCEPTQDKMREIGVENFQCRLRDGVWCNTILDNFLDRMIYRLKESYYPPFDPWYNDTKFEDLDPRIKLAMKRVGVSSFLHQDEGEWIPSCGVFWPHKIYRLKPSIEEFDLLDAESRIKELDAENQELKIRNCELKTQLFGTLYSGTTLESPIKELEARVTELEETNIMLKSNLEALARRMGFATAKDMQISNLLESKKNLETKLKNALTMLRKNAELLVRQCSFEWNSEYAEKLCINLNETRKVISELETLCGT
jgi:hypothetical protein